MNSLIGFIALGGAISGSFIIASNIGYMTIAYILFLLSSLSSVYLLVKTKDAPKSLILQNMFFVGINIFGLFRHTT